MSHVVCAKHKKRCFFYFTNESMFFNFVVVHRSNGEHCSHPLMKRGRVLSTVAIDRMVSGKNR